jgi:hypothetical protein
VVDRPNAQPGGLHPPEARFDDHHRLVAEAHVFGRERVVIGEQDILAVQALGRADGLGIQR